MTNNQINSLIYQTNVCALVSSYNQKFCILPLAYKVNVNNGVYYFSFDLDKYQPLIDNITNNNNVCIYITNTTNNRTDSVVGYGVAKVSKASFNNFDYDALDCYKIIVRINTFRSYSCFN